MFRTLMVLFFCLTACSQTLYDKQTAAAEDMEFRFQQFLLDQASRKAALTDKVQSEMTMEPSASPDPLPVVTSEPSVVAEQLPQAEVAPPNVAEVAPALPEPAQKPITQNIWPSWINSENIWVKTEPLQCMAEVNRKVNLNEVFHASDRDCLNEHLQRCEAEAKKPLQALNKKRRRGIEAEIERRNAITDDVDLNRIKCNGTYNKYFLPGQR